MEPPPSLFKGLSYGAIVNHTWAEPFQTIWRRKIPLLENYI